MLPGQAKAYSLHLFTEGWPG